MFWAYQLPGCELLCRMEHVHHHLRGRQTNLAGFFQSSGISGLDDFRILE